MANTINKIAVARAKAPIPYTAAVNFSANIPCAIVANKSPTPSFSATSAVRFLCPLSTEKAYQRRIGSRNLQRSQPRDRFQGQILGPVTATGLAVEQPTKSEFVVNLKTAKQIGLTIPPNVVARADRVIR
jgi:hypothetical protein